MAQYDVTYKCGHDGTEALFGKRDDRESMIRWIETTKLCPDCYEKEKEEAHREKAALAAAQTEDLGLPALVVGSEKQIAWAERIRYDLIKNIEMYFEKTISRVERSLEANDTPEKRGKRDRLYNQSFKVFEYLKTEKAARFYIDCQAYSEPYDFLDFIKLDIFLGGLAAKAKAAEEINNSEVFDIAPEEPLKPGKVSIDASVNVKVIYPKDETLLDIVKSLRFRWNGSAWEQKPEFMYGTTTDIAARLISALLAAGFRVECNDKAAVDRAVAGDFEPLQRRWVSKALKEDLFTIIFEKNEELYQSAMRLPNARWREGSIVVSTKHADAVEDFAGIYGFSFSPLATTLIEAEHAKKYDIVNPAKRAAVVKSEGSVRDILKSSREVISDLKDEPL